MRILLIHRHFWPDTPPYASSLRSIAGRLAKDGHDVTVFSAQPSYNASEELPQQPAREMLDGFRVVRCRLPGQARRSTASRLLDMFLFAARVFWHALCGRYDAVMAGSIPPVAVATAARLAARVTAGRFIYHHMDIYPEAALISGLMSDGLLYRTLRRVDTRNCRAAEMVIVLSGDMAETICERGLPRSQVHILNNFEIDDFHNECDSLPESLSKQDDALRIVFAGNLGHFQGLSDVIESAWRLPPSAHARIEFLGDGVARPTLEDQAGELLGSRIRFHGHQSVSTSKAFVASSDLALVTLRPGIYRTAFPSKTMTYLAMGTPLLVVIEAKSELAEMVNKEGIGFVVEPGDTAGLTEIIAHVAQDASQLNRMGERAKEVFHDRFHRPTVLGEWSRLYQEIEDKGATSP